MIKITCQCIAKSMTKTIPVLLIIAWTYLPLQPLAATGNDQLVEALDTAITNADSDALGELLSTEFTPHGLTEELFPQPLTRQSYLQQTATLAGTFADFKRESKILTSSENALSLQVTYSGIQREVYLNQPPTGHFLNFTTLEVWRLDGQGQFVELWRQSDELSALRQITLWQPEPDLAYKPVASRELAHFPPGTFLESIVSDAEGNLYFTRLMTGTVMKLSVDDTLSVFSTLPVGGKPGVPEGIMCLTMTEEGTIFADVIAPGSAGHGIWRIEKDGRAVHLASVPDHVLPNGITTDHRGHLYIADAAAGGVWQINIADGQVKPWFTGEELKRRPYIGVYPPSNGIQYWQGSLYIANSDRAQIVRVELKADGTSGQVNIHARGVGADDFAIDDSGVIYATTHPYNSVIRITRNGERTVIATPEQGVVGPTAAVLASRNGAPRKLYVVTDGGLYNPLPGQTLRPNLVELDFMGR